MMKVVAWLVLASMTMGCARPQASVMAMREISPSQQERDRHECEAQAGHADLTKPVSGALQGKIVGMVVGAGVGVAVLLAAAPTTNDPEGLAILLGGAATVGAALGFVGGTAVGFTSGLRAAHDEYFRRYTDCMRERGYAVFREQRRTK